MIRIEVAYSPEPGRVDRVELSLPDGTLLAQALEQSGVLERHGLNLASLRTGVWGRVQDLQTPLRDRDRVEVYRELQCDPKEARRLRYRKKPAKTPSGRYKATSL